MKKIIIKIALVLASCIVLSSCDNFIDDSTCSNIHIQMGGMAEAIHLKPKQVEFLPLNSDFDNTDRIRIITNEEIIIILGDSYMLYNSEECPICGEVEYK